MIPSVRLIGLLQPVDDPDYDDHLPLETPNDLMEFAGRWDYGPASISKFKSNPQWLAKRLAEGEESMIEMSGAVFFVTCSRVVSHELVRHRLASYQQESQRFVKYDTETPADLFFVPEEIKLMDDPEIWQAYQAALTATRRVYLTLREAKVPPQIARYVLPNAMRTRIIVLMNARQWRHVLALRLHTSAQPEMREVMTMIHAKLVRIYGEDLFPANIAETRSAR